MGTTPRTEAQMLAALTESIRRDTAQAMRDAAQAAREAVAAAKVAPVKRGYDGHPRDEWSCPCCRTTTDSSECGACRDAECGEQDAAEYRLRGCLAAAERAREFRAQEERRRLEELAGPCASEGK